MNRALIFFTALIFLGLGAAILRFAYVRSQAGEVEVGVAGSVPEHLKRPDLPQDKLLTEYTLTERSGREFDSQELDGSVHVVSFFFATCPSTCRAQNGAIRQLHQEYGSKGVKFLSITCDPEQDSPERLQEYASLFDAHPKEWLFLTGDLLYTRRIGAEIYQMHVDKGVHMNRLALIDKWGNIRERTEWQDEIQMKKMRKAIDGLLAETEPPQNEENPSRSNELEDNGADAGNDSGDVGDGVEGEIGDSESASSPDVEQHGDQNPSAAREE